MKIDWDPRILQDSLHYIILLPFLGALINGFFGRRLGKGNVTVIACGAVFTSFIISLMAVLPMFFPRLFGLARLEQIVEPIGTWFATGNINIAANVRVDHLSGILLLVITGVGFLIHVYSTKYMEEDPGYWKFFTYLNMFVGFMLILVLGDNLVTMFVGWEGVGLCSYLLIGFWYEDEAKAFAGRKAFVVNRIGDFGFLLGIFTLLALFGTVDFRTLEGLARNLRDLDALVPSGPLAAMGFTYAQALTVACLLLFVGATGKSAQLPLYVWLPDAMAGPTPVSALIHAATMVTAGVYMIARLSFLFALSPTAMAVVGTVGAVTALFAALMGFAQNDIKKVLAYSTVSQLGFMILGVGMGAWWQGVYHLVTHAFFKALLFLGAGSVILGCHHEQDIRRMGGLRKKMPVTALTFLIGTLAISGAVPLSGFFSKDSILHFVHHTHLKGYENLGFYLYVIGSIAAFCTAFYMFRLYFLTFEGEPKHEAAEHAHEQPSSVTVPLLVLAAASVAGLAWGLPIMNVPTASGVITETPFENFEVNVFATANRTLGITRGSGHEGLFAGYAIAWVIGLVGMGLAYFLYRLNGIEKFKGFFESKPGRFVYDVVANKFYVDELYNLIIVTPFRAISFLVWQVVDVFAIDQVAVRGTARLTAFTGELLKYVQNGDVQRYAAVMAIGTVLIIAGLMAAL